MKKKLSLLSLFFVPLLLAGCESAGGGNAETTAAVTEPEAPVTTQTEAPATEPPALLDVKDAIIDVDLTYLRDPFVLRAKGMYYVYGTNWQVYIGSKLDGKFNGPGTGLVTTPKDMDTSTGVRWAPEVYALDGKYYMITTYTSKTTGHRGCGIFKSSSPTGPFTEISNGHVTPADWDSIDGTLYIDKNGQKWMVFCHEWTSLPDGVGRMACAKLSDDMTHFTSEPVELFRATDAPWARGKITDGCFLYTCEDGTLLMIWSNSDVGGYCVGVAKSETGLVTGPWKMEEEPLYSKSVIGVDGGHGMIFTDKEGRLWMALHGPNNDSKDLRTHPYFIPLRDAGGKLEIDLYDRGLKSNK